MDIDKKLLKRIAIAAAFFALGLVFYALRWRTALVAYVLMVTFVMILAILLQSGRGGGLASLGGLGGEALFGAHAATPIAKATYVMGALFLFLSMLIARLGVEQRVGPPPALAPRAGVELPAPPGEEGAAAPAEPPPPAASPGDGGEGE